jgi:signal transduction histidine kinase
MQFERALHEQQGLGLGLAIVKRLVELHLERWIFAAGWARARSSRFGCP